MKTFIDYVNSNEFMVVAHRGASGEAPDNSIPAFQLALDAGVDIIECDVQLTKDKEVVAYHDFKHNNNSHLINELTFDEIQKLQLSNNSDIYNNLKIPSLDDILELLRGKANLIIELKILEHYIDSEDLEIIINKIIESNYTYNTLFVSFHYEALAFIKKKYPQLFIGVIKRPDDNTLPSDIYKIFPYETYICSLDEITPDIIEDTKTISVLPGVYAVDSITHLQQAIDIGLKAIGTNYPKLIVDYLKENQFK